jgi:hypothetical protein
VEKAFWKFCVKSSRKEDMASLLLLDAVTPLREENAKAERDEEAAERVNNMIMRIVDCGIS